MGRLFVVCGLWCCTVWCVHVCECVVCVFCAVYVRGVMIISDYFCIISDFLIFRWSFLFDLMNLSKSWSQLFLCLFVCLFVADL